MKLAAQLLVALVINRFLNMAQSILTLAVLALILQSSVLATLEETKRLDLASVCDEPTVQLVAQECDHPEQLSSLTEFLQFFGHLEHLNNKCLRLDSPLKTPDESAQNAERKCTSNGILFYQAGQIARLVRRFKSNTERVCTMEFSVKIYHLHKQLELIKADVQKRILRLLANSVAWKCRYSLSARLRDVEHRAAESPKFLQLINGMINLAKSNLDNLKSLAELEQFVPVLERELTVKPSNSLGQDGFEIKSTNAMRLSFEALKLSCRTLKPYHVNIFGSLGLLASLGYGNPLASDSSGMLPAGSQGDRIRINRWLISALLCQNLRNVLTMQSHTEQGKQQTRFKVMDTQEADVSLEDEEDKTFDSFRLPEEVPIKVLADLETVDTLKKFANFSYKFADKINGRKLHLLNGPNYQLAMAIETYLDVSEQGNRLEAAELLVGQKLEWRSR